MWIYERQAEAESANEQAADIPGFMAYASLAEIVGMEAGWMPVGVNAPG